jgi:hypothetical protein
VIAVDLRSTRYGGFQNSPGAVAKYLEILVSAPVEREDSKETLPPRMNFLSMAGRDPCDLAPRRSDFRRKAVSCTRDHRRASRVHPVVPLPLFSSPSPLPQRKMRADSIPCCTGVYRSCATQDTVDHRGLPCTSHPGLCGILRLVWWHHSDKGGLS